MRDTITITMNASLDKSSSIDYVRPEDKLRCAMPDYDPGGGGINVARVVNRLGGQAAAYYTCGGPMGSMLEMMLEKEGIEQYPVKIEGLTRESLTIIEKNTGQQYRFGFPGPELKEAEWRAFLDILSKLDPMPEYVVASGSLPPGVPDDFYGQVAHIARERGARCIVDTYGQPLCEAAEEGVYMLKPNIRELGQIIGRQIESDREIRIAAKALIQEGDNEIVLVSLGAGGAMLVTHDEHYHLHSPTVPIRSKIGAGDSMVGGVVHGLAQGMSVLDAVRLGVAAGAAAVMTEGTDLCHREDVERLFKQVEETGM